MLRFYSTPLAAMLRPHFPTAIKRWLRHSHTALLRVALPCRCALCGHLSPSLICASCEQTHWHTQQARCLRCALPIIKSADTASIPSAALALPSLFMHEARVCGRCLAKPPAFDATLTVADYAEPLSALARALKFKARLALAYTFATHLAKAMRETNSVFGQPDLIIPVPLSQRRLIARGYNQAWEIARPLAHMLNVPTQANLLTRIIDTPAQAKLDARERQRNMRQAFALSTTLSRPNQSRQRLAAPLQGCHIGVVDDVMTSGATLSAIARTLKRAGAVRVTNLVVLRTPQS